MSLKTKLMSLIGRGMISKVDDGNPIQLVEISGLAGEEIDAERLQPYGITSNPPAGAETVYGYTSADHEQAVAFVCDCGKWRITGLQSGEVALYSQHGQTILLEENGDVVTTMSGEAKFGNGADFVALAQKVDDSFQAILTSIQGAAVGSADGGAAFKTNLAAAIQAALESIGSVASGNLKAD